MTHSVCRAGQTGRRQACAALHSTCVMTPTTTTMPSTVDSSKELRPHRSPLSPSDHLSAHPACCSPVEQEQELFDLSRIRHPPGSEGDANLDRCAACLAPAAASLAPAAACGGADGTSADASAVALGGPSTACADPLRFAPNPNPNPCRQYLWRLSDSGLVRAEVEDMQVGAMAWPDRTHGGTGVASC